MPSGFFVPVSRPNILRHGLTGDFRIGAKTRISGPLLAQITNTLRRFA